MAEVTWAVSLGGKTFELTLIGTETEGEYLLRVPKNNNNCESYISLHHLHDDRYIICLDDRNIQVFLSRQAGGYRTILHGHEYTAQVEEARLYHLKQDLAAGHGSSGPAEIKAPMPGLVLKVEVEEGQQVVSGQGVAVVESMKMENEIKATIGGIVEKVVVEPGQVVDKGDVLAYVVPYDDS